MAYQTNSFGWTNPGVSMTGTPVDWAKTLQQASLNMGTATFGSAAFDPMYGGGMGTTREAISDRMGTDIALQSANYAMPASHAPINDPVAGDGSFGLPPGTIGYGGGNATPWAPSGPTGGYPTFTGFGPTQTVPPQPPYSFMNNQGLPGVGPINLPGGSPTVPSYNSFVYSQHPNIPSAIDLFDPVKDFAKFSDPNFRNALEDYLPVATTLGNFAIQRNDQMFNQQQQMANFAEQQRMNQYNMMLQGQATERENAALAYYMGSDTRNFGESQYQFRQQHALAQQSQQLDEMYKKGLISNEAYANETARLRQAADEAFQTGQLGVLQQQASTGQFEAETGRLSAENLAKFQQGQLGISQYEADTGRLSAENLAKYQQGQLQLGQGELSLQEKLGTGRLELDTRGQAFTEELGRSRLGLDTRALEQEAQISREQMQNQLLQSRYAAFGRAQAPSFRMGGAWR